MKHLLKVVLGAGITLGLGVLSSAYALIPGPSYTFQNGYVDSINNLLFDQETATSSLPASVCTQANVSRNFYLAGDINGDGIKDLGTSYYARDNFVMNGGSIPVYLIGGRQQGYAGTKVRYFLPAGGQNVLTKLVGTTTQPLNTNIAWYRQSKIAPKDVWVRAVESHPLLVSAPENNSIASRTFQIAYEIAYRPFSAKIAGTNNYWLYPVSTPTDGGAVFNTWYISSSWATSSPIWPTHYVLSTSSVTSAAIQWGTESRVPYECMNVTVHWCGDGIVDVGSFNIGSASEVCDLGSANGTPGSTCSSTCQMVAPPPPSDMTVSKSVTGSNIQGQEVTYTITYRNLGAGTATGVVITDTLGSGLTFLPATSTPPASTVAINPDGTTTIRWNIGNVAPGAIGTIVFKAQIKLTVPNCSTVINRVNVSSSNDSNSLNNDAMVTSPIQCPPVVLPPDLAIAKSVTGSNMQSGTLNYTITYNNIASGAATGVVVTDILGTGIDFVSSIPAATSVTLNANGTTTVRYNLGTVAGFAGGVIRITARIRGDVPNCVNVRNDVNITTVTPELTLLNNAAFVLSPIQCPTNPQLYIQKDVTASTGGYVPDGYAIYTIRYGNSGSGTATGVVLTDTLPNDLTYVSSLPAASSVVGQTLTWNIGTLLPGQEGLIRIVVRIRSFVPVCENYVINNIGIIRATNAGPVQDDAWFLVLCYDLYSNKVIDRPLVISGDIVTYTIRYGNTGQISAPNWSLVDTLPAGTRYVSGSVVILSGINIGQPSVSGNSTVGETLTWTGFTNMAPGYSGTVSIRAQIVTQFASGHVYRNVVCIVGDNNYNNNNCGEATTTTTGEAFTGFFDINLQKSIDKTVATNGETVTYTINVMNESDVPSPVNGYTVQDYLPAGVDYLGNPTGPSGMNVILSGTKDITFYNLPQLNPGDRITITFQGTYRSTVVETNYAEVCSYIGMSATSGVKDRDSNPCNRGRNTGVEDDESQASVGPVTTPGNPGGGGGGGGGPSPYCGDGRYQPERGEQCDPGNAALGIKPAGVPPGKVCGPDCKYRDQPPGMTAEVKCSYIDPPAINVGEYMPYWWDMEYGYLTVGSGRMLVTSSCTANPNDVRVDTTSLQCSFELQGPNGHVIGWTQPCYDNPHLPLIDSAFNAAKLAYDLHIFPGGVGAKQITGSYYLGLGEYMITMKVVSGKLCNGTALQPYDRVCQMNFGVTKQYAVARSVRGTFSSTSDLDTYKRQDTTKVLQVSELINALQPFTLWSTDISLIGQMVTKYVNLAVKADTITDKLPDNTTIARAVVSKVPNKNIFVIDAKTPDGRKGMITISDKATYHGGAFTLIVINGDLVIKGDLKQNANGMFIARDGDIIFSAQGDAATNNQDQQVQGIFIGLKDVKAEGDGQPAFNSDLNKPWINGGRLTINGILLGADLSELVYGRRSVVEDWFNRRAGDGLLDDGAIVIKANPQIFTNLPPGAEDISVTLNVFKN